MQIKTERKKINLNKCCINEKISEWIEQDIIVPDTKPDALKILHVNVTPYVSDVETMEDRIKVIGKLNYFVIYRVDDDKFNARGLFVSYPFTKNLEIKGINKDMCINVIPKTQNIIFALPNERKISIKSEICFNVKAKSMKNIELITAFNPDDMVECKITKSNFNKKPEEESEDEFYTSKKNFLNKSRDEIIDIEEQKFLHYLKDLIKSEREIEFARRDLMRQKDFNGEDAFRLFEVAGTGVVTPRDLIFGLKLLGINITKKQLTLLFNIYDLDGNGVLNYSDFFDMVISYKDQDRKEEEKGNVII